MTITPKSIVEAGLAISLSEAKRLMFSGFVTEVCKRCGFRKNPLKDECKLCKNTEFEIIKKKKI